MKRLLAIALGLVMLPTAAWADDALRIGTSADSPPFESVDASGTMIGFDIDLGNDLCARMKRECQFINQDFDGLVPALAAGKFDALMAQINITEKRKTSVDFSRPYATSGSQFVTTKAAAATPEATVDALKASLAGKTVGVQRGTSYELIMGKYFPDTKVLSYGRIDEIVADLKSGRIDAGWLAKTNWANVLVGDLATQFDYVGPTITGADFKELGEGVGVAIPKGNAEIKAAFDTAIEAAIADGTVDKLAVKWLGYSMFNK